jgi:hypothetical protein
VGLKAMKIKDVPKLKQQVMSMLPVTQAEIWKGLGISSREGSELIGYLLNERLINRTIITIDGKRTFLLENANSNGHSKRFDYSVLLSGDKLSPCCGCIEECLPVDCIRLTGWIVG